MKKFLVVAGLCALALSLPMASYAKGKKAGKAGKAGKSQTMPSDVYAQYDTNSNGVLDADEKEAVQKALKDDVNGTLKMYDLNNDGKLSDDEIAAIPSTKTVEAARKGKKAKGEKKEKKHKKKNK